jgi:hypothetical protein
MKRLDDPALYQYVVIGSRIVALGLRLGAPDSIILSGRAICLACSLDSLRRCGSRSPCTVPIAVKADANQARSLFPACFHTKATEP